MDLGFVQAGFAPIGAYDICKATVTVYRHNISCEAWDFDLSENDVDPKYQPDVVVAGSPCQGFSTLGTRRIDDARNSLLVRAAVLAVEMDPQVIVLENVRGILVGSHRQFYLSASNILMKAGYTVHHIELCAQQAGLPQHRRRVFLVATKSSRTINLLTSRTCVDVNHAIAGSDKQWNHEPIVLVPQSKQFEIGSVIKPGQKLCDVRGGSASVHSWSIPHVFGGTTANQEKILNAVMRLRRRIRRRTRGDADPVMPSQIEKYIGSCPQNDITQLIKKDYLVERGAFIDLRRRFNGKYRRLRGDGISNTVDTRYGNPAYFLHPRENRGLSVREAARLQGFPDSFKFAGSRSQQHTMIGNAVPVPMSKIIAEGIRQHLKL